MNQQLVQQKVDRKWLWVILLIALLSLILIGVRAGISVWFWIVLVLWLLGIVLWWFGVLVVLWQMLIFGFVALIITLVVAISGGNRAGSSSSGTRLVKCTSSLADTPENFGNWKTTLYSGPLQSSSPDFDAAKNTVRTFSLAGINNKTEKNSYYVRAELSDGGYITGFNTAVEVCDENNMTTYTYSLENANPNATAGENVVAQTHYFHGGSYISHPGTYHVDVYIRDLNKKWHFVARETGITVTE